MQNSQIVTVRRDTDEKSIIFRSNFAKRISQLLKLIYKILLES